MEYEDIYDVEPFSLSKEEKGRFLDERLLSLTRHHYAHCEAYRHMLETTGVRLDELEHFKDIPFLPVSLFKELTLKSIQEEDVVKTMTSSGTTGQKVSKIYLDRSTSAHQTRALARIVSSLIGNKRLPMIIIDSPSVVKDRRLFSARGAGILGFSMFGSKRIYALDDNMELDVECLTSFLGEHQGEPLLLFGFTFMIWQHFYKKLLDSGFRPDLSNAVLIHGGGWKKLLSESVSSAQFKQGLHDVCGIPIANIHDYYGMVEQTGSIYIECECGHLHSSVFSDVLARDPLDFHVLPYGEKGLLEVVSTLPESYPGHALLTEDEGIVFGEDDCPCGRKGKYFQVLGRIKNAEIRGCSDTYASKFGSLSGLEYVIGNEETILRMSAVPAMAPFDERVVDFFNDLSRLLLARGRTYSDVSTFGFWCRKSALMAAKATYSGLDKRLGRGVAFHSTPSNVPVNFAFSFAAGLLSGNANIVRLPAKDFPQVQFICDCVQELLKTTHPEMADYICMVKYPPDKKITDWLSSLCQSRVVWGGDATIAEIRLSPLPSRSIEVNFADRYSLGIIDGRAFLEAEEKERIIRDFYNDTYFSDQNACTSPRLLIWLNDTGGKAKELFWQLVLDVVEKRYSVAPVQSVGKLAALYKATTALDVKKVYSTHPYLTRIQVDNLQEDLITYRYNSGFFYEYDAKSLKELLPMATVKSQTVSYFGLSREQISAFVQECRPHGIDRFVPFGKSMDFTLAWDGFDLITTLSRIINVI